MWCCGQVGYNAAFASSACAEYITRTSFSWQGRRESMYAEERQEKLLTILKEKRKLSVGEMSERFNVSGATIRTDLRILEEAGMLTRTHGGAILRTRASFEISSDQREEVNLLSKEQIGLLAASLVEDGDIIVLDTGTTTCRLPAIYVSAVILR
ncbi:DeoR family regulatory protein [Yersinia frederiksenii]|nr:DeoR family regulatory protein [Yersinia frederiksenii]